MLSNYADRIAVIEVEGIQDLLVDFFASKNIGFSVVASNELQELFQALGPAFLKDGGTPTWKVLTGPLLDLLFTDTEARVDAFINEFLANGGKTMSVLERWESIYPGSLVNFVVLVGTAAVFLNHRRWAR